MAERPSKTFRRGRPKAAAAIICAAIAVSGCSGPQSALDPAGHEASEVLTLFWVMLVGAGVIWLAVIGTAVFASRLQSRPLSDRAGLRIVLWAGAIVPTLVLAALLVYGLRLMPVLRAGESDLQVHVSGEQYWWRITYLAADGRKIESANELRLPAGQAVELILDSVDVIHSLWIPALAGKMDMIPGRTNRLLLRPERTGTYRGVCAEFCGRSHALMAFPVVVLEADAFATWLEAEAAPAATGDGGAFMANGCGGCHSVRGTLAEGSIGPDLTHLASRSTLGAGTLANTGENLRRFIAETEAVKPGSRMPSFDMLPPAELEAIATYLEGLR